jgi:hypothetical protein
MIVLWLDVDRGFEPGSGQTKDYAIGMCCFSVKHAALRRKSKDRLARNRDNSLLQGKQLPFSPSPLRLNIFRLFVILSLTQLYRYTPAIFLFSTSTFKYT